ncbi:YciI family protein [Rhodococcus sp. MEB064]|uniref:YciI family protein n=1 Tax=Rhodococcus sp. MEB064 TaxID=1587522 RepID=UPI0005ABD827|nr:YciI family protein [Rhodococcus sp. MEB064]KIQ20655.1 hypothetical protein RU01_00865 [Rhodococcus sp. MEB064]
MAHFLVNYTYSSATAEGRDRVRAEHRDWLRDLLARDVVVVAGPYADDSGATIIVKGESADQVGTLFAEDPFAVEKLVDAVAIQEWKPVMGVLAE